MSIFFCSKEKDSWLFFSTSQIIWAENAWLFINIDLFYSNTNYNEIRKSKMHFNEFIGQSLQQAFIIFMLFI